MKTDLTDEILTKMLSLAKEASDNAYSPYSRFRVGAAVLTRGGRIFTGCNVENASYGLTICAERNAVFQMVNQRERDIRAVVIYTPTDVPSTPCGACRQVINEFGPNALIISVCREDKTLSMKLSDLLPEAFGPKNLTWRHVKHG